MRKLSLALGLGLFLWAVSALPLASTGYACGQWCQAIPSVPPTPQVVAVPTPPAPAPAPPPVAAGRQAPPPVFTARVHECVVREVTLTAPTRELLAERVAQARQRAECLPAGTLERNAALTVKVSELEAINADLREEILRLQGLLDETEAENWLWALLAAVAGGGLVGFLLRRQASPLPPTS
jgi:hypothetical protein